MEQFDERKVILMAKELLSDDEFINFYKLLIKRKSKNRSERYSADLELLEYIELLSGKISEYEAEYV